MPEEDFDFVIRVNLKGVWLASKAVLKYMKEQKYGRIFSLSSRAYLGNIGQSNYAASKAGVVGLTRTLAMEFARYGVTVNAVAPGFIDTPMTQKIRPDMREKLIKAIPARRIGRPEDIARATLFFVDDEADFITGQVLLVDGGRTLGMPVS